MRDENPIRTLGDYSKPSHEGYKNTIELLVGKNVVPLRSDTIRLVQNGCSFHRLRSEDPNQHLKDFLKLVDSLDLDGENKDRTRAQVRKIKGKAYNVLPRGLVYEAILKKKITKKEDMGGNFEIPCNIGYLKHINALVNQGSDVNVMPLSTCIKQTDERPAETDTRISLASHSYIYPLGIVEDILVEFAEHVYPVDFIILEIKEDEKRHFIFGTSFLTTAKAVIKFDKGTVNLRSGKSKISFHRIAGSPGMIERGVKNEIEPIPPL
nr:MAK10-like protein [Tanacetum cinerariifolium]